MGGEASASPPILFSVTMGPMTVARPALSRLSLLVLVGVLACARIEPKLAAQAPPPVQPAIHQPSTYVVIRVEERRLHLMQDDLTAPIASFPIAVGRAGHETPTGRFRVEEMVEHPDYLRIDPRDRSRVLGRVPPGPANPLGERWIGFAHGDGWSVGIHGTPRPELLGRAVSGGCIRMRNADVLRVYDAVKLGTPVVVEP